MLRWCVAVQHLGVWLQSIKWVTDTILIGIFDYSMTVHQPTIKQLQYLVALRQHGHFGRAAEACFVTQSTLSAGLRELEGLLGVTLVERTRRVVRFTPLGERIADKAVRVIQESEELAEMARAQGKPLHGELRLGVIPTIAPFLLPALLPKLRAEWPDLKLYLREETSHAACEALHRGRLDCVLLALPFNCGDVDDEPLFDDRLFIAFPAGEAPRGGSVSVDAIDEERMLLLEDGHCLKDHALSACNRPDLRAHAAMLGTSLHTLVQMVDNGLGLTFIPAMAIDAGILDGTGVEAKPLQSDHGFRRISLVWRRSSARESELRMLAGVLRRIMLDLHPRLEPVVGGNQLMQPAC
jgi:LysR family hydrogen peroxide-inducible transcriptional activator